MMKNLSFVQDDTAETPDGWVTKLKTQRCHVEREQGRQWGRAAEESAKCVRRGGTSEKGVNSGKTVWKRQ